MVKVKAIRSEADYDAALAKIDSLMEAKLGTAEGDLLDILVTLVEAYERKHYPISLPDPISAIEYHLESRGLTRKDFENILDCSSGRVSEILSGKRSLTLRMIRRLYEQWHIPAESLIQKYRGRESSEQVADWK